MQPVADYLAKIKQTTGFGYWNGTYGQIATEALWTQNAARLSSWYSVHSNAKSLWMGRRVLDCVGLDKYARWVRSDGSVPRDPDTDINETDLFNLAKAQGCKYGPIDTMPDVAGLVLWKPGHMGVYLGGGIGKESQGGDYGVKDYPYRTRPWTHWYYNPFVNYEGVSEVITISSIPSQEVYDLQTIYMELELKIGEFVNWKNPDIHDGRDGEYGSTCSGITKTIQIKYGLDPTGDVDNLTYGKIALELVEKRAADLNTIITLSATVLNLQTAFSQLNAKIKELETENALMEGDVKELTKSIDALRAETTRYADLLKDVDLEVGQGSRPENALRIGKGILKNLYGE